jgi:hypothetical protein
MIVPFRHSSTKKALQLHLHLLCGISLDGRKDGQFKNLVGVTEMLNVCTILYLTPSFSCGAFTFLHCLF